MEGFEVDQLDHIPSDFECELFRKRKWTNKNLVFFLHNIKTFIFSKHFNEYVNTIHR